MAKKRVRRNSKSKKFVESKEVHAKKEKLSLSAINFIISIVFFFLIFSMFSLFALTDMNSMNWNQNINTTQLIVSVLLFELISLILAILFATVQTLLTAIALLLDKKINKNQLNHK